MKFSNHSIVVDRYPQDNDSLVYNTRTQGMVKIDRYLKDIIKSGEIELDTYSGKYKDDISTLHEMGLVVRNEEEDRKLLTDFLGQLKYGVLEECLPITILTTYACNFKCTYCFEESSRTNTRMSMETAEHTIKWLKERVLKYHYKKLHVTFYGGEPLLNKPVLEHIAIHMKDWCEARGLKFGFMLQTNGYLMTAEMIDYYLTIGLTSVRISVDGVGEDHDKFRPLRGGGKTFERIIQNIVACTDKVKIGISTSFDKGNIQPIEKLIAHFEDLGILYKLGRFIFSPVHPTLGPKDSPESIQGTACMCNYEDSNMVDANRRIRELMESKNLTIHNGLSISICPLTRDKAGVTVDQHGRIFKCNSMLGHPELSTGNVCLNEFNEQHDKFISLDVWRQCPQDCTYMPMCSGGCRLGSFLKNKNFNTPSCHKPYLNLMAEEIIKKDYEDLMKEKVLVSAE